MKIQFLTLFPELVLGFFDHGLLKKAKDGGLISLLAHNLRNWATDRHKTADDNPYGGGPGMVIKGDICLKALQEVAPGEKKDGRRIILPAPDGKPFNQHYAANLAKADELVFICGRYEGIDDRVRHWVTDEISIGDFVVFGGELPSLLITEAVARLIPGVVGDKDSIENESFVAGRLDYPQYTRPADLAGQKVPEVLQGGDHAEIEKWRKKQSLLRTLQKRPDLLLDHPPTEEEKSLLSEILQDYLKTE